MAETPQPNDESAPIEREPAVMSVRSAAVWAMSGEYVAFGIMFITSVIISRFFLAPDEVGLFSIAFAAAMLVAVLQDFGLSRYISGLKKLTEEEVNRCSSVALILSLAVTCVIAALAWPMAQLYDLPDLFPLMLIIGASYLFLPLSVVPLALMGRKMRFGGHFAVDLGGALFHAATALTLAALDFSAFALAWATLAAGLARGIIAQMLEPARPFPLKLDGLKPVLTFGGKASALYVSGALGTRTPDLIVGKLLTLAATGLYSRAYALADQFRMLIAGAIGSVFYPAFARIRDRGEPLGPAYLRVCAGYSAIIWPGMAGLALASEPLILLLYGERWADTAPLLAWIAVSEIILVSIPLHTDLPILMGKLNRLISINILDTTLSITLLAIGCLWGVEGAAASRLVYALVWLLLYARFMHTIVQFKVGRLLRIYAGSAFATMAALAPLALCYVFIASPSEISFFTLLLAVGAGVGAWFATLLVIRHPAVEEIIGMIEALPIPARLRAAFQR